MESEASPVPIETDDPRAMFAHMVPKVTNAAELLQFHAVDAWIKDLSTRRKTENQRLLALEKLWEAHKSELEPQLRELLLAAQGGGAKNIQSLLATTYTRDREESVEWEDESDLVDWLIALASEEGTPEPEYRVEYRFADPEARSAAKVLILARAKAGLDLPPGVTITPAGKTVVTRFRDRSPVTPHTILAQRGRDLDRLIDHEPQGNQDDNDSTSTDRSSAASPRS